MKVDELIAILKSLPNLPVVVDGYEGGTDPLVEDNIKVVYVDKSDGQDWCGEYGDPEDSPEGMEKPEQVILLGRY